MKRMILGMTFASIFLAAALGLQAVEILPLAEIKAGMKGEWVTSVEGQKLERFPLEIVGISRNFAAPGRDVIWARALDERNIATGPVAGMSGSPVYIEGKWVGAYAYGFLWPKDEALIGIQPAQEMLKLWEAPEGLSSASQAQQPLTLALAGFSARTVEAFAPSFEKASVVSNSQLVPGNTGKNTLGFP